MNRGTIFGLIFLILALCTILMSGNAAFISSVLMVASCVIFLVLEIISARAKKESKK